MGLEETWGMVIMMMLSCLGLGPNGVEVFLTHTIYIYIIIRSLSLSLSLWTKTTARPSPSTGVVRSRPLTPQPRLPWFGFSLFFYLSLMFLLLGQYYRFFFFFGVSIISRIQIVALLSWFLMNKVVYEICTGSGPPIQGLGPWTRAPRAQAPQHVIQPSSYLDLKPRPRFLRAQFGLDNPK